MSEGRALPAWPVLGAAQLLTRVPLRLREAPDLPRCVPWFPVVGAVVGLVVGVAYLGLTQVLPAGPAAVLAVLLGVGVTGAFHEDGLADTTDAMGGWTPEQRRAILKDSRHGSYGVAALAGSLLLRTACLATLAGPTGLGVLVAAHALGRAAAVGVMAGGRASTGGLGAEYSAGLPRRTALVGIGAGLALAAVATGWWVLPCAAAAAVGAALLARLAHRAFGGQVGGDVLGAVEQVGEAAVLVVASGLAVHHGLWWA